MNQTPTRSRPNVLVIHTDQHRWDCLGAAGNADIRTPNLDALAADGVMYRQAFCTFPVCTPSRYSLLSGLYVHQHGGGSNRSTLPAGVPTFPRALAAGGYRTEAVGKMHFLPAYLDVGFQRMQLAEQDGPGRYEDDYHRWLISEGLCDRVDLTDQVAEYRRSAAGEYWDSFGVAASDLDEAHYSTTWIAGKACEAVSSWRGGGNMLMVGFVKPHHPFDPPAPWDRMYQPERLSLLPGWLERPMQRDLEYDGGYFPHERLTEGVVRRATAMYYALISQIDHHVGRLVHALHSAGLYDDTMIIFTSDHGEYLGFHHMLLKANHLYDPLAKVPLMIKFPGSSRAGQTSDAMVSLIDVAPTILSAAGMQSPPTMRGMDLGEAAAARSRVYCMAPQARQYMVRSPTHKLILSPLEDRSLLFDLRSDPLETQNLFHSAAHRALAEALRRDLARWMLFEAPYIAHQDERARLIDQPNVVAPASEAAKSAEQYFGRKMARG